MWDLSRCHKYGIPEAGLQPPTRPSGHRVDEGVNSFNTVKIHHAVEHDVQALEGHQGLVEKLLVETAQGGGVECCNFGGKGGGDGHCLEVLCRLRLM